MNAIQSMVYTLTTPVEVQLSAIETILTEYKGEAVQYLKSNAKE